MGARRRRGMTLIELMIVLAILAILAALVIPRFGNASEDARESAAQRQLQVVRSAVAHYQAEHVLAPVGVVSGTGWDDLRGSYLMVAPGNPLRGNEAGILVGTALPGAVSGAGPEHGWYWNTDQQMLYLIDAAGVIANE